MKNKCALAKRLLEVGIRCLRRKEFFSCMRLKTARWANKWSGHLIG
jgi:hypothetical protein